MVKLNTENLKTLYRKYGFEELEINERGILVFTLKNGHFHNADIVKVSCNGDIDKVFQELRQLKYACSVRDYQNLEQAENTLFEGFFSADETKKRLDKEYDKHKKVIEKSLGQPDSYEYIEVSYTVNGKSGEKKLIQEVIETFSSNKPTLVLIEAAAGFGKTCTAFEVLHRLLATDSMRVPLFSELSRNRQAKIFRYVFLDEIDRSFPTLRSSLVQDKIKEGKIPVILDGFDELIHQSNNNADKGYDSAEPMLDTIGELLNENSKVVLTTRRTAIFDGDAFHEWVLSHDDDFEVIRIRLNEPTIGDWLSQYKINALNELSFPIHKLNNPVLLSYLRSIDEEDFKNIVAFQEDIVEKYLNSLLDRERERQNLRLTIAEQFQIMKSIANDMVSNNYSSESRDYIEDLISENHSTLLEKTRTLYSSVERPTIDELITKLTTHALLDRVGENNDIGFINEFILGNFVAEVIIDEDNTEWAGEARFIEPAVLATVPRREDRKEMFWKLISFSLNFLTSKEKIDFSFILKNDIYLEIENDTLSGENYRNLSFGLYSTIKNIIFIDCTFQECCFKKESIDNSTFVNCEFYQCKIVDSEKTAVIEAVNCNSSPSNFLNLLVGTPLQPSLDEIDEKNEVEQFILGKFWPKGSQHASKHRPKSVFYSASKFSKSDIHNTLSALREREILLIPDKASFYELNFEKVTEVREILGRE